MARFGNVDYNKVQYKDENPFRAAFKESSKESKELAKEAYDKKKSEFIEDYLENLGSRLMPPEGVKPIVNGKVNPAFYNLMNYQRPEKVLKHAKKMAVKYGLNPSAVRMSDISGRHGEMMQSAANRYYQLLRQQGDNMGRHRLQEILQKDNKFMEMYKTYADPLYASDKIAITDMKQAPFTTKTATGWEINEERGVVSGVPNWGYHMHGLSGNTIETDAETGLRYVEDWIGTKHYVDAPVMGAWNMLNPVGSVIDEAKRYKWYKEKGVDFY